MIEFFGVSYRKIHHPTGYNLIELEPSGRLCLRIIFCFQNIQIDMLGVLWVLEGGERTVIKTMLAVAARTHGSSTQVSTECVW